MKKETYQGEIHCIKEKHYISFYSDRCNNKKEALKQMKIMKKRLEEKEFIFRFATIEIKKEKIVKL